MTSIGSMDPPPVPSISNGSRKRPRDEMVAEASGESFTPDELQVKSSISQADSQETVKVDFFSQTQNENMSSPATPTSTDSPDSGQPIIHAIGVPERPRETSAADARQGDVTTHRISSSDDDIDPLHEEPSDPNEPLEAFDWHNLEVRYHNNMQQMADREGEIFGEFSDLCNYFSIWAEAGGTKDTDRSFKRLKTQECFVQHEETTLEQRRQRFVKAVTAFKSALDLLQD